MERKRSSSTGAVGLYARISLDRQEGEGVERQLADARELIADRWPEATAIEYVDNDLSAFHARKRPEYERLLADLASGRIAAVVAYHPDRLYRHPADLERFIDVVQGAGADVATVKAGDVDLSTASGRMVARILGSVARHESERIGERVSRAKRERAVQGRPAGGGLRAYGLTADRLALVEDEADELRRAAGAILAGQSWTSVVADLNDRGVRNVTGNDWTLGNLRRTLTSPHVAGLRSYKGEVVGEASWPAIIDRGSWERLRAAAAKRKRGRSPSERHMLTGLLRCGSCGFPLYANETKGGRFAYRCSPTPTTKGKGCGGISIARGPLDALVAELIFRTVEAGALTAATARREAGEAVDVAELEAELAALADDLGAGRITRAEWLRAREGIARRLDEAQAAIAAAASLVTSHSVDLVELRARWGGLSVPERRAVAAAVIETITVDRATRRGMPSTIEGIGAIDPERVDIEWKA